VTTDTAFTERGEYESYYNSKEDNRDPDIFGGYMLCNKNKTIVNRFIDKCIPKKFHLPIVAHPLWGSYGKSTAGVFPG
jgi:hypothetical protein